MLQTAKQLCIYQFKKKIGEIVDVVFQANYAETAPLPARHKLMRLHVYCMQPINKVFTFYFFSLRLSHLIA
jgi:hypothetical protein